MFNDLWTEAFNRLQFVQSGTAECYYLSGCLDTLRKIKEQMEEKEDDN